MSSLLRFATIQIRQDTAGNWTSNNPTPYQGEWCLETDTGYTKKGDGSTAWNSLRYNIGPSWDDIRVPASSGQKGITNPPGFSQVLDDGSGSTGVFANLFSATSEEELFFSVLLPHDWKVGSDIVAHVHWLPTANGTGSQKVSWGLEYTLSELGTVFPNTTISYGNTSNPDETLVINKQYITDIVTIDMSSITTIASLIICRVFRDATGTGLTDDYTSDAALLEIDFHYQKDALGSISEFIK